MNVVADWRDVGRYVVAEGGIMSICGPCGELGDAMMERPACCGRLSGADEGSVGYIDANVP